MPDSNFTTKPLVTGQRPLTSGSFNYYTVPQSRRTLVKEILVSNTTPFINFFTINFVPDGFSVSDENAVFYNIQVTPNETLLFALNTVLDQNDKIQANCANFPSGGYINLKITGIEIEE